MGKIQSIVFSPDQNERPKDRYARQSLREARLVVRHGIEGDCKGSRGRRQLNIMASETVAQLKQEGFHTEPGELGEQIVVSGINVDSLSAGSRIQLGSAVVEVMMPRTGCRRFEKIQGQAKERIEGRLGVMARVVIAGDIALGDRVKLLDTKPEPSSSNG